MMSSLALMSLQSFFQTLITDLCCDVRKDAQQVAALIELTYNTAGYLNFT